MRVLITVICVIAMLSLNVHAHGGSPGSGFKNHKATISGKDASLEVGSLGLKVFGSDKNAFFQYWSLNDTATKYQVKFMTLFQTNQTTAPFTDKTWVKPLTGSLTSWTVSSITTTATESSFTFTSTAGSGFPSIVLTNHLIWDPASKFKFDIKIDNFQAGWWAADYLVIGFKLNQKAGSQEKASTAKVPVSCDGANKCVDFGNAYVKAAQTATQNGGAIKQVQVNTGTEGPDSFAYLIFDKFDLGITQDPELGLLSYTSPGVMAWPSMIMVMLAALVSLVFLI